MTRRLSSPGPLRTMLTGTGELRRLYRRRWHTVTQVLDRWIQRELWWDESDPGSDREYQRIVLDGRLVWDVYHGADGQWYLYRLVLS